MTTQPTPPGFDLPGSVFVVNTAQGNNGKTFQMMRLLMAVVPGTDRPAVAPALVLVVEASTEGTAGELLADESMCLVWPVATFEEAQRVITTCFPYGLPPLTLKEARLAKYKADADKAVAAKRPPPPAPKPTARDAWPLRAVAVESISSLHRAQKTAISNAAREETARKFRDKTRPGAAPEYVPPSTSGRDLENDQKRVAGLAARPAQDFVDALSALTVRHRGMLVVVACHTRPQIETTIVGANERGQGGTPIDRAVGEAPDFGAPKTVAPGITVASYADLWNVLYAKTNIVWHAFPELPDYQKETMASVNAAEQDVVFGAVTARGRYPGLGLVGWVKRQGGNGWLRYFDAAPRVWAPGVPWAPDAEEGFREFVQGLPSAESWNGGPDMGLLLELCLREHAAAKSATC